MSLFNVNWRNFVTNWLPPNKRFQNYIDYIESLITGLTTNAISFQSFEADQNTLVKVTSQTIVLRAFLIQKFGIAGIEIETNKTKIDRSLFYTENESQPVRFFTEAENRPTFIFTEPEVTQEVDFTVSVPAVSFNSQIKAQIEAELADFVLAGKIFNVVSL